MGESAKTPAEDSTRIAGYLRGDPTVFREMDQWIRAELRSRYPGLRGEHEDLCQVVHTKLLGNLRSGRYEGRSALRTYVTGIAHHTAIDRVREIRRQRDLLVSYAREPRTESPDSAASKALADPRLLHQVVLTLPEACRRLWRLVFVEKLAYEEIGRRLAIPPGTVKSRMWHCRRKAMAALARLQRRSGR